MAVLNAADRREIAEEFARKNTETLGAGITRPELLSAVSAVDDWQNANAASFNAALPVTSRTVLNAAQKARLFFMVASKRWEVG